MARKRRDYIGDKYGYITIVKETTKYRNSRRFLMKCDICGSEKNVYQSQLSQGNWNVCEHDAL